MSNSDIAVRRIGLKPCSIGEYNTIKKREELIKKGDMKALEKFDKAIAEKRKLKNGDNANERS